MEGVFPKQKKRLFILGNGFDIAHGLVTSYNAYCTWLVEVADSRDNKHDVGRRHDAILAAEGLKDFWDIDVRSKNIEGLEDRLRNLSPLVRYVDESIVNDCYEAIVKTLARWSCSCYEEAEARLCPVYDFRQNDVFITFNYTRTLEQAYKIDKSRVCHIHGDCEKMVAFELLYLNDPAVCIEFGPKDLSGASPELAKVICKDANRCLDVHGEDLRRLMSGIDEIHVVGSSISLADSPYFNLWLNPMKLTKGVKVFVHYFEDKETADKKRKDLDKLRFDASFIIIEGNRPLKLNGKDPLERK